MIPTPEQLDKEFTDTYPQYAQSLQIVKHCHKRILESIQSQPFCDGWRLLEAHEIKQDGDEFWRECKNSWEPIKLPNTKVKNDVVRRRIKSPWRRIEDAPKEHKMNCFVVITGPKERLYTDCLGDVSLDRFTHYILLSDLPPVPKEEEDKDRKEFEVKFPNLIKDLTPSGCYQNERTQCVWVGWQAARSK